MKQIWPNYSYSPATNVLTLTGLNIDRDQLLLVTAADRGRIMYNFADSSVTASAFTSGANTALTLVATTAGLTTTAALVIYYDDQLQSTSISISNLPSTQTVAGTVTANLGSALPAGTNRIGVVTIGAGTVTLGLGTQRIGSVTALGSRVNYATDIAIPVGLQGDTGVGYGYNDNAFIPIRIITNQTGQSLDLIGNDTGGNLPISGTVTLGAGTAQIGSVTASISGTVPVSGTFFQATQPVSLTTLPALVASTAQIGSVTASISNSVTIASLPAISGTVTANTFALQGTAVTTSNFTSTTASTVLAGFNATREVLTIFNEGAGLLFVCPGATCTTVQYQIRLSSGDYYEAPNHQTTITHSAVFATAGTARVTQLS